MAKALLIVESPAKEKTIQRYIGEDYIVESSVGHVKDLPPNRLGIEINDDFRPEYEVIAAKKKVMQRLKKIAREVDRVYLALDPDREGEAIAWHIAEELESSRNFKGEIYRVMFHEITKRAIEEALSNPGRLNRARFDAQQTRRILDRLVGYQISPLLWDKVMRGLSAGRVQSVAVRLVVEREREIQKFISEEYWTINARLSLTSLNEGASFLMRLVQWQGKKPQLQCKQDAQEIVDSLRSEIFSVCEIQRKERKRKPFPPFITSKMQQDASNLLRFSARRTMQIAQQLYEGIELGEEGPVGLITYMRTDSTRISDEALTQVREWIKNKYGDDYLPNKPYVYSKKKRAQDAHEAIRPTDVNLTPESIQAYLSREQLQLYRLIWKRFVASQMNAASYDRTVVDVSAGAAMFRATGEVMNFDGFTRLYEEYRTELAASDNTESATQDLIEGEVNELDAAENEARIENELRALKVFPYLQEHQELKCEECLSEQHFTQPPRRFRESTLIKELEERGIGRPSTYASILSVIQEKNYTEKQESRFVPTELGFLVTDLLISHFPNIIDVEFTAKMEESLDQIEIGQQEWIGLLREFYTPFEQTLALAKEEMRNIKRDGQETNIDCDLCNAKMVIKWGRNGQFLACSNYPTCKNTKDFYRNERGEIAVKEPLADSEQAFGNCPVCEATVVLKMGKFGRFLACSNYPECKTTMPFRLGLPCPQTDCNGEIVEKRSRKAKIFYSCSNYPTCTYAVWDKPIPEICPTCEHPFLLEATKKHKNRPAGIYCPQCNYYRGEK